MTARPAAAPVFGDFGGSNTVTVSVTVVAGANVTVFVGLCPAGTVVSRTVTSMTLTGGTAAQIAGSRVTSTDGTFTSAEWWRITAPTSGTHNLVVNLSGTCRGGIKVCQDLGDTGIGQVNGAIDSVVALNGTSTPLDSSMIRIGCVFQPNGTPALELTQAGPFQIGFSASASASTRAVATSYMRGYPDHPSVSNLGGASAGLACSAIEILS